MIKLITFFKILNLWVLFYSYWIINVFVTEYSKENKSDFFFYLGCCFYGALFGLITGVSMVWFGFMCDTSNLVAISSSETSSLTLDLNIDNLNIKNLEAQKELEEMRNNSKVWIITVLIVYYIVFSIK